MGQNQAVSDIEKALGVRLKDDRIREWFDIPPEWSAKYAALGFVKNDIREQAQALKRAKSVVAEDETLLGAELSVQAIFGSLVELELRQPGEDGKPQYEHVGLGDESVSKVWAEFDGSLQSFCLKVWAELHGADEKKVGVALKSRRQRTGPRR